MAATEIAREHGMIATFMPKPFSNRTGTGSHFHISIGDQGQKNLFDDKTDKRGLGLSKMGYQFLGGLLEHARALTAICAPTVNSYKRLVVGRSLSGATWAPAYIAYGDNNRTACVRVPYGRLELRLPDGSCNPYLATAAILAAGLDGVDRKLDPGEPNNTNLYELTPEEIRARGIGLLPQILNEAIDALEADEVVREAHRRGTRRGIHRAQAHGVDRVLAPRVATGKSSAIWRCSKQEFQETSHVRNRRIADQGRDAAATARRAAWCRC